MVQIVLSGDQVQAVVHAQGQVQLCDEQGNVLGYVARGPSQVQVAEAIDKIGSEGPWYTTEQVLRHLDSLEQQ